MVTSRWDERIDPELLPLGLLPPMALGSHNLAAVRTSLDERRAAAVAESDPGDVVVEDGSIVLADRRVAIRFHRGGAGPRPALL